MTKPITEEEQPVQGAKSFNYVLMEGALYFIIGAFTPAITMLESDKALDARSATAMVLASLVSGAVAVKAFMSQSLPSKDVK